MVDTPDVLKKILDHKRDEVASAKVTIPMDELRARSSDLPATLGFMGALIASAGAGETAIIAEIKKGSPSKGVIREEFDPLDIASVYQENGATCLSILTDSRFFMGELGYIPAVREIVRLPILRKDFVCDPYQLYEARVAGADAILLIAAMLELSLLKDLHTQALELGLDVLLEVHDENELEAAIKTGCLMIGINNRNLRTFETSLTTTERLAAMVPPGRVMVSESGINSREDILRLATAGAGAFLIGESLMREKDIGKKLRELMGKL